MKPNVRVLDVTSHFSCGVAVWQSASCKVPFHVFMLLSCDCPAVVGDFCCSCAHMGLIRRAAPVESIMSFSFIVSYLLLSFGARSWPLVCTSFFSFSCCLPQAPAHTPASSFFGKNLLPQPLFGKNLGPQPRSTVLHALASVNRAPMDTHKPRFRQPRQPD